MRTVRVARKYGSTNIEHTVIEDDKETAIRIEMPLEPFIAAVVDRVIQETLAAVGAPAAILLRSTLAAKVRTGLAERVSDAIAAEVRTMKESTVYKSSEKPGGG